MSRTRAALPLGAILPRSPCSLQVSDWAVRRGRRRLNPLPASSRIGVRHHIAVSQETRMTHATRFVAVAVLAALVLCVPAQAQTPEIDALREGDR